MIRFLDKEQELELLPQLFDILYENMRLIAPSGVSYEEEKAEWLSCVEPALEKEPRQIVLMHAGTELAGFLQYYVNGGVFMVEEVQIRPAYQKTMLFLSICRFMIRVLPDDVTFMEAYADKRNKESQKLIEKLGMRRMEDSADSPFLHYRGNMNEIIRITQK